MTLMEKDDISDLIDTAPRFAQHQLNIPTTLSILAVVKKHFPNSDKALTERVEEMASELSQEEEDIIMADDMCLFLA